MHKDDPQPSDHSQNKLEHVEAVAQSSEALAVFQSEKKPQLTSGVINSRTGKMRKPFGLQKKAALLAIAMGVIPLLGLGSLVSWVIGDQLRRDAKVSQESLAIAQGEGVSRFIAERYGDMKVLSSLPIFSNPKIRSATSQEEKENLLKTIQAAYGAYDSLIAYDLNRNIIAQHGGLQLDQAEEQEYFEKALKQDRVIISQPYHFKPIQKTVMYLAAPIKDSVSGQTIGVMRARMPVDKMWDILHAEEELFKKTFKGFTPSEFHLISPSGKVFVASESTQNMAENAKQSIPVYAKLVATKQVKSAEGFDSSDPNKLLVTVAPIKQQEGVPELNWSILLHKDTDQAFAAQRKLQWILFLGMLATGGLIGASAILIARRATRPIVEAAEAVEKIGHGQLDTRLNIQSNDEFGTLGANINLMAAQIQNSLEKEVTESRYISLLASVSQATEPAAMTAPLNPLLEEIRSTLKCDRVVVYRFYPDWSGHIVAESVLPGFTVALNNKIEDSCISQDLIEAYKRGRVVPTQNVYEAGFHPEHEALMHRLQIKSNLVVPLNQGEELFGILVAHHCANYHEWQTSEIEFMQAWAARIGPAMGALGLAERRQNQASIERERNQVLQMSLLELLSSVEGAAEGDLTVRADVSANEIGIVADFFNSIVENLRDIISQVKNVANEVNSAVGTNETAVGRLAAESFKQSKKIERSLEFVEEMAASTEAVANSAQQAADIARSASLTAQSGGAAMDRTVASIGQIRETVAETAKKVKRLGESSQQISKAVSLINQIALQTNLLAINASIEAARAGEEGRGFAVVAEEVGALASQSAAATKEIEQIVEAIQRETGAVVDAMEVGTTQVVEGTRLVEETKQSLQKIVDVSAEIDQLVQAISGAALSQTEKSELIKKVFQDLAKVSEATSGSSKEIAQSLQESVQMTRELQESVSRFNTGALV